MPLLSRPAPLPVARRRAAARPGGGLRGAGRVADRQPATGRSTRACSPSLLLLFGAVERLWQSVTGCWLRHSARRKLAADRSRFRVVPGGKGKGKGNGHAHADAEGRRGRPAVGDVSTPTAAPVVRAPRGTTLSCRSWQQEAALRMLMNNLDPEVAERPAGSGRLRRDRQGRAQLGVLRRDRARAARAGRTTRRCSCSPASRSASSGPTPTHRAS